MHQLAAARCAMVGRSAGAGALVSHAPSDPCGAAKNIQSAGRAPACLQQAALAGGKPACKSSRWPAAKFAVGAGTSQTPCPQADIILSSRSAISFTFWHHASTRRSHSSLPLAVHASVARPLAPSW
jgi:hypothetical protein